MMNILTSSQMRLAEELCVMRDGISYLELMKRAGLECARIITENHNPCNALIICGKGKNGGDGFVIANELSRQGYNVCVILASGEPKAEDAFSMFSNLDRDKIKISFYIDNIKEVCEKITESKIIIDCIFGTGFSGELDARLSALVNAINNSNTFVYSIDVPSGADCDKPEIKGSAITADCTIAISSLKNIHITKPISSYCGEIKIADIGISKEDHLEAGSDIITFFNEYEVKELLPKRPAVSNKGTYGHTLNICGSLRMQGAAVLAAKGATKMGAGLVTAAFPEKAYCAVSAKLTEPLLLPLASDNDGFFAVEAEKEIISIVNKYSAVLAGCGIGKSEGSKKIIQGLLSTCEKPIVLDADGLNIVSESLDILKNSPSNIVITPHPGEMSRLTGKSIEDICNFPIKTALKFANEYNVTVVLKGANTIVCAPSCPIYINTTGNTSLSKGGSGDLLAGMIVSLIAQGINTFDAACIGVYLHGLCADRMAKKKGERFITPSEIADKISGLLSDF